MLRQRPIQTTEHFCCCCFFFVRCCQCCFCCLSFISLFLDFICLFLMRLFVEILFAHVLFDVSQAAWLSSVFFSSFHFSWISMDKRFRIDWVVYGGRSCVPTFNRVPHQRWLIRLISDVCSAMVSSYFVLCKRHGNCILLKHNDVFFCYFISWVFALNLWYPSFPSQNTDFVVNAQII